MHDVSDIKKRLGRLTNDRQIPHRARMDISDAIRILVQMAEDLNAQDETITNLEVYKNRFEEVEDFCETLPKFKELLEAQGPG